MARVGFFRVKLSSHLLLCNKSAGTNGTEVDWIDIHNFLHFIDRLEVLVGRFNGGRPRGIFVPLMHSLNRSNCIEKLMGRRPDAVEDVAALAVVIAYVHHWKQVLVSQQPQCAVSTHLRNPCVVSALYPGSKPGVPMIKVGQRHAHVRW